MVKLVEYPRKKFPVKSDEKLTMPPLQNQNNPFLIYVLGNTMCITPKERRLGRPITKDPKKHLLLQVCTSLWAKKVRQPLDHDS